MPAAERKVINKKFQSSRMEQKTSNLSYGDWLVQYFWANGDGQAMQ